MKATITQINKKADGYSVVCDIEGRNARQFGFGEEATVKDIRDAIKAYLQELKSQEGRLPQLRTALINDVIEV